MAAQTYEQALASAQGNMAHCPDEAFMAALAESTAQVMLGAVSPRLIWEGAMKRGLTAQELAALIDRKPQEAEALQWL